MIHSRTSRGFDKITFDDLYRHSCSIQKSSIASRDAIWFGIDSAEPQVMASEAASVGIQTEATNGWVPYPIPDNVLLSTRMHLSREQVMELIPILQNFVDTGDIE